MAKQIIGYDHLLIISNNQKAQLLYFFLLNKYFLKIYTMNSQISIILFIYLLEYRFKEVSQSLRQFTTHLTTLTYCKIYFRRKGSWVTYRASWPSQITWRVGFGHPVRLNLHTYLCYRIKKYLSFHVLFLICPACFVQPKFPNFIHNIKPFNQYTKRGIKLVKKLYSLRVGKESQYTKLKSKIF